jgi:hypothetical protein
LGEGGRSSGWTRAGMTREFAFAAVLKTTYYINKIKNGYKDVKKKIKLLTH